MSSPALDMPTTEETRTPELEIIHPDTPASLRVLTPGARAFLARLADRFTDRQRDLLQARRERQARFDNGALPDFDPETVHIREGEWRVNSIPVEVRDRRTEITGPVSRKMVINALNSGAQVYMADFEDSTSPTWHAIMDGQVNLMDAIRREIDFATPEGKHYRLNEETAVLMVRPRGLHLPTRHLRLHGKPIPGSLVDFGLFLYHNHEALWKRDSRPYLYLPKLEHYSEAQYWDDVISWAEEDLGMERGTVKVTVLIETLPAVFQMHEILHALKDRILGLNCGRWDYIFSYIKTLRAHADRILPDRGEVTMGVPFMSAYSRLLVQTCHRRGAFAMGGMGGADSHPRGRGGQQCRHGKGAGGQDPRGHERPRRHLGGAPGPREAGPCRIRQGHDRSEPDRHGASGRDHHRRAAAGALRGQRHRRRASGTTSACPFSTWRPGWTGTAACPSTT